MTAAGGGPPVEGGPAAGRRSPRTLARLAVVGLVALALASGFAALGVWQVQRLAWKQDLIARVDARIHAAPTAAPGPAAWPSLDPVAEEYRHVAATGRFLGGRDTFVQAVSDLGGGYWVISPFLTDFGFTVLVNRGFVPPADRGATPPPGGATTLTGLLRATEPGGGFLRANDAAADRWYSRDVAAIAAARGLTPVAPYFIDADATPGGAGAPVGGLTVVRFANNHLVYALTWFTLAAMVLGGALLVGRRELTLRRCGLDPAAPADDD